MTLYTLALFLHISGAIGVFGSLFLWLFGLAAMRRAARVEQVRAIAWMLVLASPLMVGSVLLLGIVFLMTTKPALVVAILVMAVTLVLALVLSLPLWMARQRQAHGRAASTTDGEADPFLKQTLWTRRW